MTNTFDYIIVGAGSAGCVLANRLGADTSKSILIVEAGPMDRDIMIHIPAGVYKAWRNPKLNWNYLTEAEVELDHRAVEMPRGKVVGGSSSINSMVYMRGHPLDYDLWASECNLPDWRYAECLPYFKAGESSDRGGDTWRGAKGELGVTQGGFDNPLYDAFIEAGTQAGQGYSEDLNAYNPEGVARLDATRRDGRRCSAAVAHLKPALKRGNVTLLCKAHVHKVIMDGYRAEGIRLYHKGQLRSVYAESDVILSGGAINSPKLLLLSGIGPAKHLRDKAIELVEDVPAVGQHLQDHLSVILQYSCTQSFPIHRVNTPLGKCKAGLRWVFSRDGIAASNIWEAGGLIRSCDNVRYPDLQYHFGPVGFEYNENRIEVMQGFSLHVDMLRPRSSGSISLYSSSPDDAPLLNFNYLAEAADLGAMVSGVRRARELVAQTAFDKLRGIETEPGIEFQNDNEIEAWIRQASSTDFHPCGTCRMSASGHGVVDSDFKVHGISNLRVVDASVMPQIVSGNLNAPTQMIAARAADQILGNKPLAPEFAEFVFA